VITVLQSISIGILVFFLVCCVATVRLLAKSVREISWYARGQEPSRTRPGELAHRPSVSLVTPAYNEETLIVQSAKAFLASDYAPLEVVVVDDGSRDDTFARFDEAFDLVPLPLRGRTSIKTAPIRSVHISRTEPRLRLSTRTTAAAPTPSTPASRSPAASSSSSPTRTACWSRRPSPARFGRSKSTLTPAWRLVAQSVWRTDRESSAGGW
jgi:cellulose synthase/poly-beta-1,6-N-acetylglucosamine synthase-like glycosyltransferase